ncbi:DUF4112 domain-containing protein [Adhaeribacter sp. BT258]|uniref:DUF4112 domain-containing protein n=1 Tax=Adhaeribacter terrigena TaxID=2793070 RepID=A0ABS1C417_9BACT|nr:DUF4112 domain-containing protein [Adhaeribacter terrigena]MBK0404100.1 DUF4112 domain-containing protein [Adhaeribacter terrigena]
MAVNDDAKKLRWVESVARLMDSQFRLPGTNFRFGLDPILGLVPFLGDVSSFAVSGTLVLTMARHGASRHLIIRMVVNIILDMVIGSIPILGALFDFGYKANERNVRLLKAHYHEGKYQGSGTGFLTVIIIIMVLAFALVMYGLAKLIGWLYGYVQDLW